MFLFDKERTGRIQSSHVYDNLPQEIWKISFKQDPIRCAESTPVIDGNGNMYFGSHNGCIYCLDSNGSVKWQFVTEYKVYSSPLLVEDKLYIGCNASTLLCLNLEGELVWRYDGYLAFAKQSKLKRLVINTFNHLFYDYEFKKFMKINTWVSPNLVNDKKIAFVFYGLGLVLLDKDSGQVVWQKSLGNPGYHLAGVAVVADEGRDLIAVIGQNSGLHLFQEDGNLRWKKKPFFRSNAWANPSIDPQEKCIYHSESFFNKKAIVYKTDLNGTTLWKREFPFGCRASVAISRKNFIVFLGLNGTVYLLDKATGKELYSLAIASKDRGLWTSPSLMANDHVLINTKKTVKKGSLVCLSEKAELVWEIEYAKALSVPVIDSNGFLYSATWAGDFYKFKK